MAYTNRNTILNELLGSIIGTSIETEKKPEEAKLQPEVAAPVPVIDEEAAPKPGVATPAPVKEEGEAVSQPDVAKQGTVTEGETVVTPAADLSATEGQPAVLTADKQETAVTGPVTSEQIEEDQPVSEEAIEDEKKTGEPEPTATVTGAPGEFEPSETQQQPIPAVETPVVGVQSEVPSEAQKIDDIPAPAPDAEAQPDEISASEPVDVSQPDEIPAPAPVVEEDTKQTTEKEIIVEDFEKIKKTTTELNDKYKSFIDKIKELLKVIEDSNISIENKEELIAREDGLNKLLKQNEVVINSLQTLLDTYDDNLPFKDKDFFQEKIKHFVPYISGEQIKQIIIESEQIIKEAESEINSKLNEAVPVSKETIAQPIVAQDVVPHKVPTAEGEPIENGNDNGIEEKPTIAVAPITTEPVVPTLEQPTQIESLSKDKLKELIDLSLTIYKNIKPVIKEPKKDLSVITPGAPLTGPEIKTTVPGQQPVLPVEQVAGPEVQKPAPGAQPPAPGAQPPAPGAQTPAPGVQPPEPGLQPPAPGTQPQIVTTVTSETIQKDKIRELIEKSKKIVDDLKNKQAPAIETRPSEAVAVAATSVTKLPADATAVVSQAPIDITSQGLSSAISQAKTIKDSLMEAKEDDVELRQAQMDSQMGFKPEEKSRDIFSRLIPMRKAPPKLPQEGQPQAKVEPLGLPGTSPQIAPELDSQEVEVKAKSSMFKMPTIGLPTMPKIPSFGTKVSPEGVPGIVSLEPLPIEDYIQHSNQNIEKIIEKSYTQTDAQKFVKKGLEGVKNTGKAVLGSIATNLGFSASSKAESKPVIEEVEEKFITTPGAILIVDLPNMNQYEESLKKDPEEIKRENTEIQSKQKREQVSVKIEPILGTSENELKIETKEFNTPTPTTNTTTNAQLSQVQNTAATPNIQQMNQSAAQPTGQTTIQPTMQPTIQQTSPPTTQPIQQPAIPSLIQKSSQIKQSLEKVDEHKSKKRKPNDDEVKTLQMTTRSQLGKSKSVPVLST
jgi:hypothetical protein